MVDWDRRTSSGLKEKFAGTEHFNVSEHAQDMTSYTSQSSVLLEALLALNMKSFQEPLMGLAAA